MSYGFLILCRNYARRDSISVMLNDTRYYHEFGEPYILRDFETRQATMADLERVRRDRGVFDAAFTRLVLGINSRTAIYTFPFSSFSSGSSFNDFARFCIRYTLAIDASPGANFDCDFILSELYTGFITVNLFSTAHQLHQYGSVECRSCPQMLYAPHIDIALPPPVQS